MGSSNIGRSASRRNLTHVAIPGSPIPGSPIPGSPILGSRKTESRSKLQLFSIADCRITLNLEYRRKSAGNQSCDDSFPLYGNKKRVPNRKKVAKISEFLFLQRANHRDKADPRKLSNKCRVEAKREAKESCHPCGSRPSGTPAI